MMIFVIFKYQVQVLLGGQGESWRASKRRELYSHQFKTAEDEGRIRSVSLLTTTYSLKKCIWATSPFLRNLQENKQGWLNQRKGEISTWNFQIKWWVKYCPSSRWRGAGKKSKASNSSKSERMQKLGNRLKSKENLDIFAFRKVQKKTSWK